MNGPEYNAKRLALYSGPFILKGLSVAASTYNQRLAIISSWYTYVGDTYKVDVVNPIKSIKKRPVQAYAGATPLEVDVVSEGLESINRETLAGMRDYALVAIALQTGRRASELAHVTGHDVSITKQGIVTLTFHAKGDKVMRDTLPASVASAFLDYLRALFGDALADLAPHSHIWLSFAHNESKGQPIGPRALSDIWVKYLGTSKVHATRHTFAVGMMRSGAAITELQARLGHSNVKLTGMYAHELTSNINPHGEKLAAYFGIKAKQQK